MTTCSRPPLWTKTFLLIGLLNTFLFMSYHMFPAALPPYLKELGASDQVVGWVMGAATIASIFARPAAGLALDKIGRRGVLLSGLAVMLVTTAALYFFPFILPIFIFRIINGLGWGLGSTASSTIVSDCVPKERFGEGMGYFSLSSSLPLAVAPALALSLSAGGMIWMSAIFIAITMAIAATVRFSTARKGEVRQIKADAQPVAAPPSKKFPYEKSAIIPAIIVCFIFMVYGAISSFIAIYAAQYGIDNVGAFFIVYAVAMLLARPYSGWLVDRKGLGVVIVPCCALIIVSLLIMAFGDSMFWFMLSGAIFGVGKGALQISAQTMAVVNAPQNRIGAANATFYTGFDCGIGLGAILAGNIAAMAGYSNMYLCFIIFPVLSSALFILYIKKAKAKRP